MYIAGEAGTEWIAPNWMTRNPAIAPIISHFENLMQKRIYASEPIQAFAEGGFTSLARKMAELNKIPNMPGMFHGFTGAAVDKKQNGNKK